MHIRTPTNKDDRYHWMMYEELGRNIVAWSRMEFFLNYWLLVLLGAKEEDAKPFITTVNSDKKISRIKAILKFRFPNAKFPNEYRRIESFFSTVERLRRERNDYIHSAWMKTELKLGGNLLVHGHVQRQEEISPVIATTEFTTAKVRLSTKQIWKTIDELDSFIQKDLNISSSPNKS